jgi:hypothetical protein
MHVRGLLYGRDDDASVQEANKQGSSCIASRLLQAYYKANKIAFVKLIIRTEGSRAGI